MKNGIFITGLLAFSAIIFSCNGQPVIVEVPIDTTVVPEIVGGGCDGCELMYEGMPENISAIDTSEGWKGPGQKIMIAGTVYKNDGTTPASGVILYYWHTDSSGHYSAGDGMNEKAKQHGNIRGWIKTDILGKYAIYTVKPGAYPGESFPAHIHLSVKEPGLNNEYYIDDFVFADDVLLTPEWRSKQENRGGSGILSPRRSGVLLIAEHDIILGKNIPGYVK